MQHHTDVCTLFPTSHGHVQYHAAVCIIYGLSDICTLCAIFIYTYMYLNTYIYINIHTCICIYTLNHLAAAQVSVTVGVIGYPNVGKSSLINSLVIINCIVNIIGHYRFYYRFCFKHRIDGKSSLINSLVTRNRILNIIGHYRFYFKHGTDGKSSLMSSLVIVNRTISTVGIHIDAIINNLIILLMPLSII